MTTLELYTKSGKTWCCQVARETRENKFIPEHSFEIGCNLTVVLSHGSTRKIVLERATVNIRNLDSTMALSTPKVTVYFDLSVDLEEKRLVYRVSEIVLRS